MNKDFTKYFLFFVIFLIIKCNGEEFNENIDCEDKEAIEKKRKNDTTYLMVKQTIIEHVSYYPKDSNQTSYNITRSFIDFYMFRFYYINMSKINPNINESLVTFNFYFREINTSESARKNEIDAEISIECAKGFRCNEFISSDHKYVSFDFDYYITQTGGVISFILVLIGIFCLMNGYIYYNITIAFYSGLSFFLLWKEICELMELNHSLNILHNTSIAISKAVYAFALITSIGYGYISIKIRYLKYISFGFIDGLIFAKVLYFYILFSLNQNHKVFLGYIIIEIISCVGFIVFFFLFRNKYLKISIGNVSILASYGILYGSHILIGGIPFLPFCILSKILFEKKIESDLFDVLRKGNGMHYYVAAFVALTVLGFYLNYSRYKLFIEKKKKNISTL